MPHSRKRIPLAHSLLSAGASLEIGDDYSLLDVNDLICRGRDDFLVFVVTGDSMREDIQPGYLVFVNALKEPENGDTVAVSINNETCIKIFQRHGGHLYLVPKNSEYEPRRVYPTDNLYVMGVVRGHLAVY